MPRSDHARRRHPAPAVPVRTYGEDLVDADPLMGEADRGAGEVDPPGAGPGQADQADGLVPVALEPVEPGPQRPYVVLTQGVHITDLEALFLQRPHRGGHRLQLAVGKDEAADEGRALRPGAGAGGDRV